MYAEVIPPSITASRPNCAPIAGNATVIEEPVYGTRNDASDATMKMTCFSRLSSMGKYCLFHGTNKRLETVERDHISQWIIPVHRSRSVLHERCSLKPW